MKLPIFSIKFDKETKVADFKNVKYVCWCKVKWEKSFNPKSITQCYRCQIFGHIAKNCHKIEVCAICAGGHNTKDCANTEGIKCSNCKGNHKANDKSCEYYKRATERKTNNGNRFIPTHMQYKSSTSNRENTSPTHMRRDELPKYSSVLQGRKNDNSNNNGTHRDEQRGSTHEESFASMWHEIKDIFKNINFGKILNICKNTVRKIKKCNDNISKFTCLFEGVMEIFE